MSLLSLHLLCSEQLKPWRSHLRTSLWHVQGSRPVALWLPLQRLCRIVQLQGQHRGLARQSSACRVLVRGHPCCLPPL